MSSDTFSSQCRKKIKISSVNIEKVSYASDITTLCIRAYVLENAAMTRPLFFLYVCQLVIMDPAAERRPLPPALLPPPLTHTHTLSLFLSVFLSISQSVIMEPSSPKKIQFAAPPLQGQLDPQAAEHVSAGWTALVRACGG